MMNKDFRGESSVELSKVSPTVNVIIKKIDWGWGRNRKAELSSKKPRNYRSH